MRSKVLLAAIVVGAVCSSAALASPQLEKGKPPATGPGCRPQVTLVVKGTAAADGGASALSLTVSGGNHFAKLLFANNTTTTTTVNTTSSTQVTLEGNAGALTSIKKGDRVLVQYRVCKADLKGTNTASASALTTFLSTLSPRKVVDLGTESD